MPPLPNTSCSVPRPTSSRCLRAATRLARLVRLFLCSCETAPIALPSPPHGRGGSHGHLRAQPARAQGDEDEQLYSVTEFRIIVNFQSPALRKRGLRVQMPKPVNRSLCARPESKSQEKATQHEDYCTLSTQMRRASAESLTLVSFVANGSPRVRLVNASNACRQIRYKC